MAADTTSLEKKVDLKKQFLTCSICNEPFDNGEHQAKYLHCLHSYCTSCLKASEKSFQSWGYHCPNCHFEFCSSGKNLEETVDSLPSNFLVQSLKEHLAFKSSAVCCGNCDKGNQAVKFCHDCGYFQCQDCVDNHQMKILQHHKLSSLEEIQEKRRRPPTQKYCKKHPLQQLNLYCKEEGCQAPVCASCGLVSHHGHSIVDLSVEADEKIAEMKGFIDKINVKKKKMVRKQQAVDLEKALKSLRESYDLWGFRKMSDEVSKIQSLLQISRNTAFDRIGDLYESRKNILTMHKDTVAQMTSACSFATILCSVSDPVQLLTSQKEILNRLKELDNREVPKIDSIKTEFAFTEEHDSAMKQILECIKTLKENPWVE